MRLVSPSREPVALLSALAAGALVGAAPMQEIAATVFNKAGLGNFFAINVLLPLATVVVAVAFPRLRTAAIAGVLVVLGFVAARLLIAEMRPWRWNGAFLLRHTHPIEVAAAVGCAAVGMLAAVVVQPLRRVGAPPQEPSCRRCGHALAEPRGAEVPTMCPECGLPTDVSVGARAPLGESDRVPDS